MKAVLFVCLGSICRSPAMTAIFNKKAEKLSQKIEAKNRAVAHWSLGYPPFPKMVEICAKKGYVIDSTLHSELIRHDDFEYYDLVLAADRSVKERLYGFAPENHRKKVKLLTSYSEKFHDQDIPDPYEKGDQAFELAITMIEDSIDGLLKQL